MSDLDIKRLDSYQYPNTHIGHLSAQHREQLEAFKQLCESKGYYTARGKNGLPSHDDETMLRYLRARKFVPQDAFHQFKDTEDWRKENQIDKLYDTIDVTEYDQSRRLYPQWTGRLDRRGIPLYLFEVAHLNSKAVAAYESSTSSKSQINLTSKVPPKMLRLFALYENLVNFALPLCSSLPDRPYPETPVSQSNNIVDISNVGLRQFWSLKNHMQDASQLATAHYPETLDRIFIIGAPSFFPTVWGWIKRWFDPITVSKIFILSKENMKTTLEQYIDPENIPKQYGGKLEYKFGDLPNLDPKIQQVLKWSAPEKLHGHNTFPTGPIRWQRYENGDLAAVAVGSENGHLRDRKIATLTPAKEVAQTGLGAGHQGNQLYRTTTGVNTHPPEPTSSDMALVDPLAVRLVRVDQVTEPPSYLVTIPRGLSPSTDRDGTSTARYQQQGYTHAHGNVAEGTPHIQGSQGDTYGVMEPNTVGQAPKEHPLPVEEPPAPSYLDQAKSMAGQAAGTAAAVGSSALAAVGLGGYAAAEPEPKEEEPKAPAADPAVDNAAPHKVEEFLRSQYSSQKPQKEAADKI
ncbi:hypothetical protein AAFC00_006723 [Neodothiora populina]|uniref:CRAL-TRIO domain-containing protein n=1 Tax=Neodothiora populina TaxID=2781224 RepID=A0ABR3PB84_9PEZI